MEPMGDCKPPSKSLGVVAFVVHLIALMAFLGYFLWGVIGEEFRPYTAPAIPFAFAFMGIYIFTRPTRYFEAIFNWPDIFISLSKF